MLYFVIDNHDKELGHFNSFGQATLFMLNCWEKGLNNMDIIKAKTKKQFKKIVRKKYLETINKIK